MTKSYLFALTSLSLLSPSLALAETAVPSKDEIIVTANRIETPLAKVGSSVSVITEKEIEDRQNTYVSDILREVPGMAVNRTAAFGSVAQVRIRGAEGNHTLVLIDGVRMNNPAQENEFYFSHLLSDDIGRIEILRGSQSTLYGSEAIGGVINIISRRATEPLEVRALLEGGSFNTARGNLSLLGKSDRLDYALSASGFTTAGVSSADAQDGNTERDGYRNATLSGRFGYDVTEEARVTGAIRYTDSRTEYDPTLPPTYTLQDSNGVDFSKALQANLGVTFAALEGRFRNRINGAYSKNTSDSYTNDLIDYESDSHQYRAEYQGIFELLKGHTVTAGADVEKQKLTSSYFSDKTRTNHGFFGLYEARPTADLTLTAGVRDDHYESFGDKATYRFTGAYMIPALNTKLRASYGTGFQSPTLTELYSNFGNPNLRPETSKSWDAGLDSSFLADRIQTQISYFQTVSRNLIAFAFDVPTGLFAPFNVNRAHAHGVEFAFNARVTDQLDLGASYTYTIAKDQDTDLPLLRRPKNLASANAHYRFDNRLSTNLNVIYNGASKDLGQIDLKRYWLVNLAAAYQITEQLELTGRVENLLDEKYQQSKGFGTPGIAGYVGLRAKY